MKKFRLQKLAALVSTVLLAASACSADQAIQQRGRTPEEAYAALMAAPLPESQTLSGNYLAGRFAQRQQDWRAAQNYMSAVMAHDQGNPVMMQKAFLLSLGAGEYAEARPLAEKIAAGTAGASPEDGDIARVFLACDALSRGEYGQALAFLRSLPEDGFGQYTKPLLTAWALAGDGRRQEALDLLSANADPADPSYRFHAGMIEEMAGDMDAAAAHYKHVIEGGLTLHSALLIGNFYVRYDHPEVSELIYGSLGKLYPLNPFANALALQQAERFPNIERAADGAAYALFDLATLLYERKSFDSAQIYANLSQLLMPKSPFTEMMLGDIAALHDRTGEAVARYDAIGEKSPLYWLARLRVAEVHEIDGRTENAISLLQELANRKETRLQALVAIGDIHRRHENFAEALAAYDAALLDIPELTEEHWPVIYARGMALERLNDWPRAEKDLLTALSFQPDNPMILNYIGYSWTEKGVNPDRAMEFIRRAVDLRPDDGYILDSYGWALYRSGHVDESVGWLEKATAMVPDDTTILDHLGDAYWQAGRKTEARFQWERADALSRDDAFKNVLRQKIRSGPAPLGAPPAQKEARL